MRLSALDCIGRGVANLRANWELALMQLAQAVVCALLAVAGLFGLGVALGVSVFRRLGDVASWEELLSELQGLTPSWGLLVILFAAAMIVTTLMLLVYCWFQAGIFTTLERGERQAPPSPRAEPALFRTYEGRYFRGWAAQGAWRYFWFVNWAFLVVTVVLGLYVGGIVAVFLLRAGAMSPGLMIVGCLALVPALAMALVAQFWMLYGQAILPRESVGVLAASARAWRVLMRRFAASLLFAILFVLASIVLALVFAVLTQALSLALDGAGVAWFGVQLLLTLAQWLASCILSTALFATVVALVRSELDAQAA
jgi:hypothetical protein